MVSGTYLSSQQFHKKRFGMMGKRQYLFIKKKNFGETLQDEFEFHDKFLDQLNKK